MGIRIGLTNSNCIPSHWAMRTRGIFRVFRPVILLIDRDYRAKISFPRPDGFSIKPTIPFQVADTHEDAMKTPPAVEHPSGTVTVLSISPVEDDHNSLKRILNGAKAPASTISTWTLQPCSGLESALPIVRQRQFSIIVSERDLSPGTWQKVLAAINELPNPPLLIVTSRLADERLWGEVLDLGGWDVLSKPFNAEEVRRVFNIAWLHWHHNAEDRHDQTRTLMMAAAG